MSRVPEMARRIVPVTDTECGKYPEFRWNHGLKEVRRSGQRETLDRSEGERRAAKRPKTSPSRREVERAVWPLRSTTALFALSQITWLGVFFIYSVRAVANSADGPKRGRAQGRKRPADQPESEGSRAS